MASTPKQLMVYEAFGWASPIFGHMALIINSEADEKLSKRDESILQFTEQYRELGYLLDAMFNSIALSGWSPVGEDEILEHQGLIKMFDPKRLSKPPAVFDVKKLQWVSSHYIKAMDLDALTDMCPLYLIADGCIAENPDEKTIERAKKIVSLYQSQMSYATGIVNLSTLFFNEHPVLNEAVKEVLAGGTVPTVLHAFKAQLEQMEVVDAPTVKAVIKAVQKETGVKEKSLFTPIRVVVSGQMHGSELPETVELLGREKSLAHLNQVLN